MKNKIMVMMCLLLPAVPVLSFADDKPAIDPKVLANKRAHEKATFDYHQSIYNDKANTAVRAKNLVVTEKKTDDQEKNKVEKIQDQTKGQILLKF